MLTPREIRDRILAQIAATLGAADPPWYLAAHAAEDMEDAIGRAREGALRMHLAYAVAVPSTTWLDGRAAGPRRRQGQAARTEILVRWTHRLRVEDHDGDYAAALDAEMGLIRSILATPADSALILSLAGDTTRRVLRPATGPVLLGDVRVAAHHFADLGG